MKHLKTFESLNNENLKLEIAYNLIKNFNSEQDFRDWCMEVNEMGPDEEEDDINFDGIIEYDLPRLLGFPAYGPEGEIISEVLTEIDFDDPEYDAVRSGDLSMKEFIEKEKFRL